MLQSCKSQYYINNQNILLNKKSIFWEDLLYMVMDTVGDWFDSNGTPRTVQYCQGKGITWIKRNQILAAIPDKWRKILKAPSTIIRTEPIEQVCSFNPCIVHSKTQVCYDCLKNAKKISYSQTTRWTTSRTETLASERQLQLDENFYTGMENDIGYQDTDVSIYSIAQISPHKCLVIRETQSRE